MVGANVGAMDSTVEVSVGELSGVSVSVGISVEVDGGVSVVSSANTRPAGMLTLATSRHDRIADKAQRNRGFLFITNHLLKSVQENPRDVKMLRISML